MLRNEVILTLLSTRLQLGEWKGLAEEELMQTMGRGG